MRIPEMINKNGKKYRFIKAYPNHFLYQEMNVGYRESFLPQDLVQIKNNVEIRKNIKPEMDRYF